MGVEYLYGVPRLFFIRESCPMTNSHHAFKKILLITSLFFCSFSQSIYAGDNPSTAIDSPELITNPEYDGGTLYLENCAGCHEGQIKKAPHFSLVQQMTPNAIFTAQESGLMKDQASALNSDEHQAIAEYITGIAMSDAPSLSDAKMCEAGSSSFDFNATPDVISWGVTPKNHRYQSTDVTGIKASDIPNLTLKWAFRYPGAIKARSQPLIAGGMLFVGSHAGIVYALDKDTGCMHWTFQAKGEVRNAIVSDQWTSGDTTANPRLYFGDILGNIYAIEALTGKLVWSDRPDPHPSATITAALTPFEDKLFVPISSLEVTAAANPEYACCTFRGNLVSYQSATGKKNWQSYTITKEPYVSGQNSIGTDYIAPSGAPIWNTPSIDVKRRRLYAGTGENYSSPADGSSDAIIAFDLDSGKVLWKQQTTAGDAWNIGCEVPEEINCPPEDGPDYDFAAATIIAVDKNGKDIILSGQKSGEVFAMDPDNNGEIIWQNKVGRGGIQGGIHFGMALDGQQLYVPISDFFGGDRWPGTPYPGMFALDITTGKALWYTETKDICDGLDNCFPGFSAAATAIEGGVIAGAMDGHLRAYDRESGKLIWDYDSLKSYDTIDGKTAKGGSFGGGQGPIFKDGMMYVNSGYGVYTHMGGNVLLAFELKKSAK